MSVLLQDLRFALRQLGRHPGFAAVAVLTLALGIGAATALFSVVHGVLLRPLPFPQPDRIVQLWQLNDEGAQTGVSDPNFADWAEQSRSFQAMAQFQSSMASVAGGTEPIRSRVATVSRDFFQVMGVQPVLGRGFVSEELHEGGVPAVIVGYEFWQSQLGGTQDLGGRALTIGNDIYTVVGVLPPGFDFPAGSALWSPRELRPVLPSRTALNWQVIARLRDGVALSAAQQELSAISRELKRQLGDNTWMSDAAVVPLHEQLVGRVRPVLLVLLGAAAFLLLVAGANVTNLLLARMAARQQEMVVRVALGASRWRLVRQSLTESLVLSLTGGALGVLLAAWGVRALLALEPGNLPRTEEIGMNPAVLGFTLGISVLTAALIGLTGALRASRSELRGELRGSQRSQSGGVSNRRIQGSLVAAQVALTLVLLVGAGLLGRTLLGLLSVDPGFRTQRTVTMSVSLTGATAEQPAHFHGELLARLREIPGVEEVGGVNGFPLTWGGASGTFLIQNHPDEVRSFDDWGALSKIPERTGYAELRIASDGYFRAMDIPLQRGRLFDERDGPDAPHVALISESLARTRWPGEDPIGKLIQFGNMDGDLRPMMVIGIVGDVRAQGLDAEPQPTVYALYRQRPRPTSEFTYVLYGSAAAGSITAAAHRILREVAPEIPPRFRTVQEVIATPLAPRRFSLILLGTFGVTALLLAALGIYGITSYTVTQRTREIGIRVALGAQREAVLGMVVRQGAILALAGLALGALGSVLLARFLAHLLYGVSATDPLTVGGAIVFLLGVALVASYLPARRAARVDPMVALRSE